MKETIPNSFFKQAGKALLTFALTIFISATMIAQVMVSGKVIDEYGVGLPGVSVLEVGTTNGTITDIDGMYSLRVSQDATIQLTFTGYATQEVNVGSGGSFNFNFEPETKLIDEVVVTGYQIQRKRDISGAVSVINTKDLKGIQSSSFTQTLAGRAPGVTVSSSGSPGDATNVRVRGISSFSQNDPLVIIDGVPTTDKYNTSINPNDIESMQVLKDASTASIYGSRASNGVLVITTKKGKSGKVKMTYDGSYGIANPVKGFDEVLNTDSKTFVDAIKLKFAADAANLPPYAKENALPKYVVPNGNNIDESTYDPINNPITLLNQSGTNWWKEMTRPAAINNQNLTVSGGSDKSTFMISGGYLAQEGVLNHTDFNRGSLRANTTFNVSKKFRIGENLVVARTWGVGVGSTGGQNNEQGVLGSLLKANPLVSVRDIKGNPGSNLSAGLSNNNNPVAQLEQNKDNKRHDTRLLGNLFAEFDVIEGLTLRTSFGSDIYTGIGKRFTYPNPYRNEGDKTANSFSENWNNSLGWTWTNTAAYKKTFSDKHNVSLLAGQEAIENSFRYIGGGLANYFTTDVNSWYLIPAFGANATRNVYSGGGMTRLSSYFGKADYSYDDKYFLSGTIRRDGSSNFIGDKRYGIFPAFSAAWRVSSESFLSDVSWLSDLKLRASYGELGNQAVARNYGFTDIFGGDVGSTGYDITGSNGGTATGFTLIERGNQNAGWETSKTRNFGFDLGLLDNALSVNLDIYKRNTDNLLFNPQLPGTAGSATAPFVNVGSMVNTGFDLGLNYSKNISKDLGMNIGLNLAHYKNEIVAITEGTEEFFPADNLTERLPQSSGAFTNRIGYPISSFRGFEVEGLITNEADVQKQVGSAIGGLKFKDQNGDGIINDKDNTIIGSPHPDLVAGLNLGFDYKNFDINAFIFGSYGNQIFNATKIQTYFMNFNSNVGKDILSIQGTGLNPKINGLDASSRSASSFYVEDGSYTRLSNLSIGYKIKQSALGNVGVESVRLYVQGQNLFTITGYSGVDPAVSNANIGNSGNVNDLRTGYDNGNYPSNMIVSFGLNIGF